MVDAGEVDDLKGEQLKAEVVCLAKANAELDMPKGHKFLPWHDPIEQCLAGA